MNAFTIGLGNQGPASAFDPGHVPDGQQVPELIADWVLELVRCHLAVNARESDSRLHL
jgi:hypothetical protein